MPEVKVAAGIVTYNPEGCRLYENVTSITPQVKHLYVYDNASSNTSIIDRALNASSCPVTQYWSNKNDGIAVALNHMANCAFDDGYTHLLLLDQDSVVSANLITLLIPFLQQDVAIVAANPVDRNTGRYDFISEPCIEVDEAITSGSLLNLSAHRDVGGYDERLFVDWVDYEFCDNLIMHDWHIIRARDATILHECANQEMTKLRLPKKRKDSNGWELKPVIRMNWTKSRFQDQIRSRLITIEKYKGTSIGKREKQTLIKAMIKYLLVERGRVSLIKAYINGWRDAYSIIGNRAV